MARIVWGKSMVKDSGIVQRCLRRIYLPCIIKLTFQRVWIEKSTRASLFLPCSIAVNAGAGLYIQIVCSPFVHLYKIDRLYIFFCAAA